MKIWFLCDLHLSSDENTLQYSAYDFILAQIKKRCADAVAFVGDFTSDGNGEVYTRAVKKLKSLGIPALYIPGNSDLRDEASREKNHAEASPIHTEISGVGIYAINDSDGNISEEALCSLDLAKRGDIVFMHHPVFGLEEPSKTKFKRWREEHPDVFLFFGHIHKAYRSENDFSLPALDPDKSIGQEPTALIFDTESNETDEVYFPCPMPLDLDKYFGLTAYREDEHVRLAAEKGLPCLELRPGAVRLRDAELTELIGLWRKNGGKHLSLHLPEISYRDGEVITETSLDKLIRLADLLKADRLTQHAPKVPVRLTKEDPECLSKIAKVLASKLDEIKRDVTVGIENMHMTKGESPLDTRRYGYIPEECLEFMNILSVYTRHKVGINFDIGHARNNEPFSQIYQIGGWLSAVGKYCVGYHIHQVSLDEKYVRHNHTAITDVYGHLISYASFFRSWSDGRIAKAPIIFEMDEDGAYEITLDTFKREKERLKSL